MNTKSYNYTGLFYRALATVVMSAPMLLVLAVGTRPDGERGAVILDAPGRVLMPTAGKAYPAAISCGAAV